MNAPIGGFNCPHCGQHYSLAPAQVAQYAGQTIACTVCKRQFTVPQQLAPSVVQPPMMVSPVEASPAAVAPGQQYPQAQGHHDPHVAQPYAAEEHAAQMRPEHQYQRQQQAYQHPYQPPQYAPSAYSPPPYQQGGYAQYAGQGGYAMGPMVGPATSGLAIASLICGLIFFIPLIPALLALIFGFIALRHTKDGQMGGRGLAVAGMICAGASLMLWGTCMLGPLSGFNRGFATARQQAKQAQCSVNLRQIGLGLQRYAAANGGQYPAKLSVLIEDGTIPPAFLVCPHTGDTVAPGADAKAQAKNLEKGGHLSYVYVGQGLTINSPADAVLAHEKKGNHKNSGMNVLFNDGRVEWYDAAATATLLSELSAGNNPPKVKAGSAGEEKTDFTVEKVE
jgi:prepilin-type processing-associated H-X9-DG protein